ncbi:MAG: Fic family protein [Gammaproteobacteria bacterium]
MLSAGKDVRTAKAISRMVQQGQARKLAAKIYTTNLTDAPESIIHRHLFEIAGTLYPDAVVSHRSALEGGPTKDGSLFLSYKHSRNVTLPGHILRLTQGPEPLPGDRPFIAGLYIASDSRAFLENLASSRARSGPRKTLSREQIESRLDRICRIHGEDALNELRDNARRLTDDGRWQTEFERLDTLVGAILGTHETRGLKTEAARARALGLAYDPYRLKLFNALFRTLLERDFRHRPEHRPRRHEWDTNRAFFEAYFSNFIEGTRFEVEEARKIVLEGDIPINRPADSHDVLGTFRIVSDPADVARSPQNYEDFLALLRQRHAALLAARPQHDPGQFKDSVNRAGQTIFVLPELVRGTLQKAFDLYQGLTEAFARAAFLMFIVSEVHPFIDGNGRIARIMMNAELSASDEVRIIIPTVYREDYLGALRLLSREGETDAYVRMLERAHAFTAWLDFDSYAGALTQLEQSRAFHESSESQLIFSREPRF